MEYASIPFDTIFQFVFKLYQVIYTSAYMIWIWFSEPIDSELAEFLRLSPDTLNIEMIFGAILIFSLVTAAVKLFNPLS